MNSRQVVKIPTMAVVLILLFMSGCTSFLVPELGVIAREDSRIYLSGEEVRDAVWQTRELKLTYSISETDDEFQLLGQLAFDRSVTDSFGIMKSFFMKMSFVDEEGHVLQTVDIVPVYGAQSAVPARMNLGTSLIKPPAARAIVFNYYGVFRGNYPKASDDWTIFYFPFG